MFEDILVEKPKGKGKGSKGKGKAKAQAAPKSKGKGAKKGSLAKITNAKAELKKKKLRIAKLAKPKLAAYLDSAIKSALDCVVEKAMPHYVKGKKFDKKTGKGQLKRITLKVQDFDKIDACKPTY